MWKCSKDIFILQKAADPTIHDAVEVQPQGVEASPSPWAILGLGKTESIEVL